MLSSTPLPLSLLHFIFLLLSLTLTSAGCPQKCGKLQFSYPFGVGPKCSMDPSFNIICKKTRNHSTPYLNINKVRMLEIVEIKQTQIRVKYPYLLAATCYTNTSVYPHNNTRDGFYSIDLTGTQYSMSDKNWLTAIGCEDIVAGFGENKNVFAGGCVSYCPTSEPHGFGSCPNTENGYSAGNGCCRTPIPKGTTFLAAQLSDLGGKWLRDKYFPCSYAFVVEKRTLDESVWLYPFSDLNKSINSQDDDWVLSGPPPVVRLDWRVGTENCSEAQKDSSTYACKANTDCVNYDANTDWGYLCSCKPGYHGNPYNEGCQDINECNSDELNPCDANAICTNTIGSVNCSCPKGYNGDGKKNGKGCIPSNMIHVFIGVGSGMGFLLVLSMCILVHIVLRKRRSKMRKEKFFKRNGGLLLQQQTNECTIRKTKLFSAEELEKATDNFNESRILGQGGQGTVYKGMLPDGKIVAIKKSKLINKDQLEQFINEVVILSHVNHKNVVKLWGCCMETDVPLLVYELVPNGTLFDLIHDPNIHFQVSWNMRLKIAADIAGALAYLHSALSIPIYHRDVKSSNILLDEKYTVKLSDFGISREVATDRTHLTTLVKGTFGYFDPEYFQSSQFTEKSDVYSFGVVLVELLTGQRPIDVREEERSLVMRFLESMEENNLYKILDEQVLRHGKDEELSAVSWLAQRCLNWKGKMRPTMKEVARELESLIMLEEDGVCKAKSVIISDGEYAWTTSGISDESTSCILTFSSEII
ncbi:wall-associated receptor kinase-like 8 [Salvia miltiorrhiza]|uniref:wall-associated receptor kinase-like 8 n=1 Tax=Salvia miltiorrhiza TaxID=226208 RepID=UPI0025AC4F27|nr:wall-associated receptor kinase-like 8 [Salvia miltiorrhiza]